MITREYTVFFTEEELKEAIENARTIGAYNIPNSPEYIGSVKSEHDTFHFYKDKDGKYFFESERLIRFDREMEEAQKRLKEKRRRRYVLQRRIIDG